MPTLTCFVSSGGVGVFAPTYTVLNVCNQDGNNPGTIVLPSNIRGSVTLRAWTDGSHGFKNQNSSKTRKSTFYLCDSAGNNKIDMFSITLAASTWDLSYDQSWYPKNVDALIGKTLYAYIEKDGGQSSASSVSCRTGFWVSFTYVAGNPVSSGNLIRATDRSQLGIATTAGTTITDSHFGRGTSATASGFNSAYGL